MREMQNTSSFLKQVDFVKKECPLTPSVKPLQMLKEPPLLKLPSISLEDSESSKTKKEESLVKKGGPNQDYTNKNLDIHFNRANFCLNLGRKNKMTKRKRNLSDASSLSTKNSFLSFMNKKRLFKNKF